MTWIIPDRKKLDDSATKLDKAPVFFLPLSYLSHSEHAERSVKEITASRHLASSASGGRILGTI